ncbi:hypothetical protein P167DRAFT_310105 [Morchella conica CCBAS932]|uniref:Uncharacterized protein n=1 Tax=Morchella conica CCBAS932 TaxID=1392247 RepID=A0A3N4L400_9PEZI|nr:hypothetical protein P167DRAFT_310105 [Morchella conica CCBAS932]
MHNLLRAAAAGVFHSVTRTGGCGCGCGCVSSTYKKSHHHESQISFPSHSPMSPSHTITRRTRDAPRTQEPKKAPSVSIVSDILWFTRRGWWCMGRTVGSVY